MRNAAVFLVLLVLWVPGRGQDFTSDTLAIREVLKANGMGDRPLTLGTTDLPQPPRYSPLDGRVIALSLSGLGITRIPSHVGALDFLRELYLDDNGIDSLPAEIGNLTRLTRLEMRNNRLTSLPPEFGNLNLSSHLYLQNNQITSLPNEFGNLKKMNVANLNSNKLQSLPDSIGGLAAIVEFRANDNELAALPPSIGNLKTLRHLFLKNNRLAVLPNEISGAENLSTLDAGNNQLTALPNSITSMANLQALRVGNNKIAALPTAFALLRRNSLGQLDVANNELTELPPDFHREDLAEVKFSHLNIHGNRLCDLPAEVAEWLDAQDGIPDPYWRTTQRCGNAVQAWVPHLPGFQAVQRGAHLEISLQEKIAFRARVYDQGGRLRHVLRSRDGRAVWDVSSTEKGVYFLRVEAGLWQMVKRVVVY